MFCPSCGSQINEGIKFCKQCGANLLGVRESMTRPGGAPFDWSKTWVAEMMMSEAEYEKMKGLTPEIKRYNDIKAGVITAAGGLGLMIFLHVFFDGIANYNPDKAVILDKIWIAGILPFFIGIGLIINGLFVSKRIVEAYYREMAQHPPAPKAATTGALRAPAELALPSPSDPSQPQFSVAEPTTRRIHDRAEATVVREND
jgi:hypothetical protein